MKAQKSTVADPTSQHNCVISVADVFLNLKMKPDSKHCVFENETQSDRGKF